MKIRVDHVTNSSSESFAIVLVDTAATLVGTGAATMAINAVKQALIGDASQIAKQIAGTVSGEAAVQADIIMDGYTEAETVLDSETSALKSEIDGYKAQWAEADKTADKSDPGYDKLKDQYDNYMKYLESQIQQKEYDESLMTVDKAETKEAKAEAKAEKKDAKAEAKVEKKAAESKKDKKVSDAEVKKDKAVAAADAKKDAAKK